MRQNFNVGQEVVSEDLNSLQGRLERGVYDDVIYELMGRKTNSFFKDSFSVQRVNPNSVLITKGVGFQERDTGTKEPSRRPLILRSDLTQAIDTPDSSNPRIDIIAVCAELVDVEAESRKFKDEFTDDISTENFVISKDWQAKIEYVTGVPEASPTAPAVPAGYLKICEIQVAASTGIPVSGVTDSRGILPVSTGINETGSSEYNAIVGVVGQDQGANFSDLKSALDNASRGWKILVLIDQTINSLPVVGLEEIEIVFKRGVSIIKGSQNLGLRIDANDCKLVNARFLNFSVSGDYGVRVSSGVERTYLDAPRFSNCDSNVDDLGSETYINVEYTE